MGQGRKKCARSDGNRCRHRSISFEMDNQETINVMNVLGIVPPGRSGSGHTGRQRFAGREATPLPTFTRGPRRDSLIDYIKAPIGSKRSLPTKSSISFSEEIHILKGDVPSALPLISTTPLITTASNDECASATCSIITGPSSSSCANLLIQTIFPNNTVYMNGKGRELTESMHTDLLDVLLNLIAEYGISTDASSTSCNNRKDIVRSLLHSKIERILSDLIQGCRYENIYGFSARTVLIMGLYACMPDIALSVHRSLYETLVDFYEAERDHGVNTDDDIYLRDSSYGQVHRLIELWQCIVNSFYEKYSSFVFSQMDETPSGIFRDISARLLYQCLFVLLRISGVVSKYNSFLVSGILKLFYIDQSGIHSFIRVIISKWPYGSSKKAVAHLEMISSILEQCHILIDSSYETDTTELLAWICHLVNSHQAEVSMQALQILDSDHILMNYIVHDGLRIRMVEECLNKNQIHWNEAIRELGESLFDHLLDYV